MAFQLSNTTRILASQINKTPIIILEIEGSDYVYGTVGIFETAKWDDPRITWDNTKGITWDGIIERADSRAYISTQGLTSDLSQQLIVEKGGAGSVSSMTIPIVDKDGIAAKDLSFDNLDDPLGKKANVYVMLEGGIYPTDALEVLRGYVDEITYELGQIKVSITHPSNETRQPILEQYNGQLSADIDANATTIPVVTTSSFINSQDILTSYIRIDDEVMEVISSTSNSFEVVRGQLGTLNVTHEDEADIVSIYRMQGLPIDLALKLLLSKEGNEFSEKPYNIRSINFIDSSTTIDGAILVDNWNIQRTLGLEPGDFVELSGTASNDGIYTCQSFAQTITGQSYIVVEESLTLETGLSLPIKVKSQYNTAPMGVGLDMDQVDVAQFESVAATFSASFIEYDFRLQETVENVKEFIESELFNPQALYYLPKGAKISCKFTAPPFTVEDLPTLNTQNITNISRVIFKRSTHKYLTNTVVYRYSPDILENEFRDKVISVSATSFNRINRGVKKQTIESKGIRRSSEATQVLSALGDKYLDRYRFGARFVKNIEILYEVGIRLQVGDVVFFGGEDTQLVNIQTGERDFPVAQYEIINIRTNIVSASVKVDLLETGFGIEGIRGVFSPSSLVSAGSTTDRLILTDRILDTSQTDRETEKWANKLGLKVRVYSQDYTRDETTTLTEIDPTNIDAVLLDPPLSFTPQVGDVVELAKYPKYGDEQDESRLKQTYTFTMPSVEITNVVSPTVLEVENVDGLEVGMEINVHSNDYVRDSSTVLIDNIIGLELTLNEALDITPQIGDRLEVYAYADAKGYRFL